jgi:phage terminase large subunit GpA-like protein
MSWVEIAQRWEAAQGDPELLKEFINTVLGEVWQDKGDAPEWDIVYNRRETYLSGTVPAGGLAIFGGVDVQKDRLEVGIWAFGRNRERWLIAHIVLPGPTNRPEVWRDLEKYFDEPWEHESGAQMMVRDWGIDSGAFTAEVYAFVRSQRGRANVHAVDGQDKYTAAYLGVGGKDVDTKGKKLRRGLRTIKIGVSFCKQELVGQLALQRPEEGALPAGYVHLPSDITEDQAKQLTAESLVTKMVNGRQRREWQVIEGRRNEVLDCANYARGIAALRGWDRWKEPKFQELAGLLSLAPPEPESGPELPPPTQLPPAPPRGKFIQRRRGWLGKQQR